MRILVQRERNLRLRGRVDLLLGENEELHKKVSDLKVRITSAPVSQGWFNWSCTAVLHGRLPA